MVLVLTLCLLSLFSPKEELLKKEFRSLLKKDPAAALHIPCILPTTDLEGLQVTSLFGYRKHPLRGLVRHHDGIDLSARGADVVATACGQVKSVRYEKGYGNRIVIDHFNGYETLYGHLSSIFVEEGQYVNIADPIGRSGATGAVTGEHIHYEVHRDRQTENPIFYLLLLYDSLSGAH